MTYPDEIKAKYNECMYEERDVIYNFLKKVQTITGKDSFKFDEAIKLNTTNYGMDEVTGIKLDEDKVVVFYVSWGEERECYEFAYGELEKIITKLPDNIQCYDEIIDTYNAHSAELVRRINKAWNNEQYHDLFADILLAILTRDMVEYADKFGCDPELTTDFAMSNAHNIMENICDDWDLETILLFIRFDA